MKDKPKTNQIPKGKKPNSPTPLEETPNKKIIAHAQAKPQHPSTSTQNKYAPLTTHPDTDIDKTQTDEEDKQETNAKKSNLTPIKLPSDFIHLKHLFTILKTK